MTKKDDLKSLLIQFWREAIEDGSLEFEYRLKASEFLAKYGLGEGKTLGARQGAISRPSTVDVLRIASDLEASEDGDEAPPRAASRKKANGAPGGHRP